MLQPSSPGTGHHTVILSWNASAPSAKPDDKAVGYCLYRSKKKNAARQNPTCTACEQINLVPIASTSCVDDLVEDGASYYYVAIATNTKGQISDPSNEMPVAIPSGKQSIRSASVASYPRCRAGASSK